MDRHAGRARRGALVFLAILIAGLWGGTACRSALNADEFIAATLGGRAGEIGNDLRATLPQEEKTAIARYLAGLEPLAGETLRLLDEAEALQLATRSSAREVAAACGKLATRSGELAGEVKRLTAPAALAPAHAEVAAAYEAHAVAAAAHAGAFAEMDFAALRRLRADHDLTRRRILAAHEGLERAAAPLFRPDKPLKIRPQR